MPPPPPNPAGPLRYTAAFGLLGLALANGAAQARGFYWALLWPALAFATVAAAYGGLGPRVFGKRPDGGRAGWSRALLLPYGFFAGAVWHAGRLLSREPCCHQVAPGLWLGRRALPSELPAQVGLVVDLTAEFAEPRGVAANRVYRCLPTLDDTAPPLATFAPLVAEVAAFPGVVYVHCASGHGRSAAVVAAVLIAKGLAADAAQAESLVRQVRPGVRLNAAQRRVLQAFAALCRPATEPPSRNGK